MKELKLNNICQVINVKNKTNQDIMIKKVSNCIERMDSHTLVFHLQKTKSFNMKKFNKLKNCFIVTDQPLLKEYCHLKKYFLFVSDIEKAYYRFISYYRSLFNFQTIAITGTCGKTTTKEMIKQVLAHRYNVTGTWLSKNSLSFNLDYLMKMDENTQFGVYETALTNPGNLIYSGRFFKPQIGVITNIGVDHLSGCKTLQNYILAKGEMVALLDYQGTLIINADDDNIDKIDFSSFQGRIITTGIDNKADYTATDIRSFKDQMQFILIHASKKYSVSVPGVGKHNVYNALQALAVLDVVGFPLEDAISHLKNYHPVQSHLEFHKGFKNSLIVDDTWSSNPTSVKAALEALKEENKIKIVVLGNISYLGKYKLQQCQEIGKMIVDYQIDYLITVDQFSKNVGKQAIRYGMKKDRVIHCGCKKEINAVLTKLIQPNALVLFKTSMLDRNTKQAIKNFMK